MSNQPGYKGQVAITTTSTSATGADVLPGVTDWTFPRMRDQIDRTNTKDAASDASRRSDGGLKSCDPSVTFDYDPADAIVQRIETALDNGSSVWFQYSLDATWGAGTGKKIEVKVESLELSNDAASKPVASVSFKMNGHWASI